MRDEPRAIGSRACDERRAVVTVLACFPRARSQTSPSTITETDSYTRAATSARPGIAICGAFRWKERAPRPPSSTTSRVTASARPRTTRSCRTWSTTCSGRFRATPAQEIHRERGFSKEASRRASGRDRSRDRCFASRAGVLRAASRDVPSADAALEVPRSFGAPLRRRHLCDERANASLVRGLTAHGVQRVQ